MFPRRIVHRAEVKMRIEHRGYDTTCRCKMCELQQEHELERVREELNTRDLTSRKLVTFSALLFINTDADDPHKMLTESKGEKNGPTHS